MKITTLLLTLATAGFLWNPDVQAAEIIVQNTSDSEPGSLRQAIADAHAGDVITFNESLTSKAIVLTSGELFIEKSLTIQGLGARLLTVQRSTEDGTPEFRICNVAAGVAVNISRLTIANGRVYIGTFDGMLYAFGVDKPAGTR